MYNRNEKDKERLVGILFRGPGRSGHGVQSCNFAVTVDPNGSIVDFDGAIGRFLLARFPDNVKQPLSLVDVSVFGYVLLEAQEGRAIGPAPTVLGSEGTRSTTSAATSPDASGGWSTVEPSEGPVTTTPIFTEDPAGSEDPDTVEPSEELVTTVGSTDGPHGPVGTGVQPAGLTTDNSGTSDPTEGTGSTVDMVARTYINRNRWPYSATETKPSPLELTNIVLNKNAIQTCKLLRNPQPVSLAVDGKSGIDFSAESTTHTCDETSEEWWSPDSGEGSVIGHVVIFNRSGSGSARGPFRGNAS